MFSVWSIINIWIVQSFEIRFLKWNLSIKANISRVKQLKALQDNWLLVSGRNDHWTNEYTNSLQHWLSQYFIWAHPHCVLHSSWPWSAIFIHITVYPIGRIVVCVRVVMLEIVYFVLYEFFKFICPMRILNDIEDIESNLDSDLNVWYEAWHWGPLLFSYILDMTTNWLMVRPQFSIKDML